MIVVAVLDTFRGYLSVPLNDPEVRQYGFDIFLGWRGGIVLVDEVCLFAHDRHHGHITYPKQDGVGSTSTGV